MMEVWCYQSELVVVKHQADGTQLFIHVAILSSQLNLFLASLFNNISVRVFLYIVYSIEIIILFHCYFASTIGCHNLLQIFGTFFLFLSLHMLY